MRLGTTLDDAVGEAFDKTAKLLGLPYPGGPAVERARATATPAICSAVADAGRDERDFSLSGLKTALRLDAEKIAPLSEQDIADLCASFQRAIFDSFSAGNARASVSPALRRPTSLVAAGGVAANR